MSPSACPFRGETRRTLALLSLASAGWAFSFGLGAPLASLWLHEAGCSAKIIGLNTSVYYLGVAVASLFVPRLMRGSGRACVVSGMIADALTTALFPWGLHPMGWFALRLIAGVGSALSLIPLETLVNHNAPSDRRARDFGIYAFSVALGVGLGSVAGYGLYTLSPQLAFVLGGLVTLAAAGFIGWGWPAVRLVEAEAIDDRSLSFHGHLLSFGTAWVQGFLEGGMLTFLTIYLVTLGLGETTISGLLGGLFLGVVISQLPLAWLADRLGRLRILLVCHAILFGGLLILPACIAVVSLGVWLFLLGACCGALYPLGLVLLGDRVQSTSLAKANAWYLASNCTGSLSGPVLLGFIIDLFGMKAQFAAGAAAIAAIVLVGLAGQRRREMDQPRPRSSDWVVSEPAA
ncbi:MAG TPA: MFS transporter [Gemmataceae bacterium]|nr:MFS transporter [Gemmataceae bacterium]